MARTSLLHCISDWYINVGNFELHKTINSGNDEWTCSSQYIKIFYIKLSVLYKLVQIWPGLFVCKSGDISPGHIWTTL